MEDALNHDPDLCARLIPTFQVGCRRLNPGENYLEALQQGNVTIQDEPIQEIFEGGIRSLTSTEEFDIIVCATGFDVSFVPGYEVLGQNGISLAKQWKDAPEAYFGVCAANMPNFFTINGPNSPIGTRKPTGRNVICSGLHLEMDPQDIDTKYQVGYIFFSSPRELIVTNCYFV